jgi:hypothetical protein
MDTFVSVQQVNRVVSHFAVSRELSSKSSITIVAARADGNVSSVQIDTTTIREKVMLMRVLVVIV